MRKGIKNRVCRLHLVFSVSCYIATFPHCHIATFPHFHICSICSISFAFSQHTTHDAPNHTHKSIPSCTHKRKFQLFLTFWQNMSAICAYRTCILSGFRYLANVYPHPLFWEITTTLSILKFYIIFFLIFLFFFVKATLRVFIFI